MALVSPEHHSFLDGSRPDCSYDLCFKPELRQDYHQWRTDNILKPYQANKQYYQQADCPIRSDGGEQFCVAITDYITAKADYEAFYLNEIQANQLTANDPDILREYEKFDAAYRDLQRGIAAVGDFDNPYEVYRHELNELEQLFASKQL